MGCSWCSEYCKSKNQVNEIEKPLINSTESGPPAVDSTSNTSNPSSTYVEPSENSQNDIESVPSPLNKELNDTINSDHGVEGDETHSRSVSIATREEGSDVLGPMPLVIPRTYHIPHQSLDPIHRLTVNTSADTQTNPNDANIRELDNPIVSEGSPIGVIDVERVDSRTSIASGSTCTSDGNGNGGKVHKYKFFISNESDSRIWCAVHEMSVFYTEVHEVAAGATNVSVKGGANQFVNIPPNSSRRVNMPKGSSFSRLTSYAGGTKKEAKITLLWTPEESGFRKWYYIRRNFTAVGNSEIVIHQPDLSKDAEVSGQWLDANDIKNVF